MTALVLSASNPRVIRENELLQLVRASRPNQLAGKWGMFMDRNLNSGIPVSLVGRHSTGQWAGAAASTAV